MQTNATKLSPSDMSSRYRATCTRCGTVDARGGYAQPVTVDGCRVCVGVPESQWAARALREIAAERDRLADSAAFWRPDAHVIAASS